jgi:transcriptional regulator with XRE-family HTH domain
MELAEKAGLSLRTIQRFEAGTNEPKGHSLKVISKAFDVDISIFQKNNIPEKETSEADKLSIKLINLSALAFLGIPFGNLIFPFFIWTKKR